MKVFKGLSGIGVPVVAVVLALLIGAVMIAVLGGDPLEGYWALVKGAFGDGDSLADTAVRAMPLLLVGTGICIAFRAKVINIGGEGQIISGAMLSTITALALPDLQPVLLIPLVMLAGIVGGGFWGAIPGTLKAYLGVNEILSTIMLNIVAVQIMNYLLRDPLIDPKEIERGTRIPQTERLSENADLPIIVDGTRLHLGVIIAVLAAVVAWVILWRTTLGYRIRAVGSNPAAARYAGIPVKRMTMLALTFSGAMCGLAGAVLVFGSLSHRFITDGSSAGFTQSSGFNGIVAGLFGGLHPLWTIFSSFLFGGLLVGADAMQRAVQVNSALIIGLNGLVVVFVVSSNRVRDRIRETLEIRHALAEALAAPAEPSARQPATEPPVTGPGPSPTDAAGGEESPTAASTGRAENTERGQGPASEEPT